MRTLSITITVLACLTLANCGKNKSGEPAPGSSKGAQHPPQSGEPGAAAFIEDVDAVTAGKLVAEEHPPVVLDVRTAEEFASGHIEGAVNIDFNGADFKEEVAKLDREKPYLLHCRSGGRSGKAKATFEELGFKAIYHLDGGILAWEKADLPTVK